MLFKDTYTTHTWSFRAEYTKKREYVVFVIWGLGYLSQYNILKSTIYLQITVFFTSKCNSMVYIHHPLTHRKISTFIS